MPHTHTCIFYDILIGRCSQDQFRRTVEEMDLILTPAAAKLLRKSAGFRLSDLMRALADETHVQPDIILRTRGAESQQDDSRDKKKNYSNRNQSQNVLTWTDQVIERPIRGQHLSFQEKLMIIQLSK